MDKLCNKDMTGILINVMYVKLLLTIPRNMVLIAGNAAWILSIYVTLIMLLIFYLITKVYNYDDSPFDIDNNFLRITTGVITTVFLLLSMSSITKIYPETVKIILLRNTPLEVIFLITGITAVIGALIGIQPLGRIASLFQPVAGIIMLVCLILLIPHMKITNLAPVLGNGISNIAIKGCTAISGFSDIILIFILPGKNKNIKKTGFKAIMVMGIIMTLSLLAYSLIFPDSVSADFILPIYQLVRLIQVGDFFGRFEAFFEFVWSISILIYFSVYLYALSIVWQKTFKLEYSKPLIAPFMIIISVFVYLSGSFTELNKNYVWYSILLIFLSAFIPVFSGIIKRRK